MKSRIKKEVQVIGIFLIFLCLGAAGQVVQAESCFNVTPKLTNAAYEYLSEFYIRKYPAVGLEFTYGTKADQRVLKTLADKVTRGCGTQEEMAQEIAAWTKRNIEYSSYLDGTNYYPIDVFYERKGNCVGYALLMAQLMRIKGIPAVWCNGMRGDMVHVLRRENIQDMDGHAWVFAYYNKDWHLFDPLFDVYGSTDREFIAKWYLTNDIEGIAPSYEGMDKTWLNGGWGIFQMDGRFINCAKGIPASLHYGTGAEGGKTVNGCISLFSKNRHKSGDGGQDGFDYVDNPGKREGMVNDECYTDGWISYSGQILYLARPNGILTANTVRTNGKNTYFFAFDGTVLEVGEEQNENTLTQGYLTIKKGSTFSFIPTWAQAEKENGRVLVWKSETPEIAVIDQNGVITGQGEGLATLSVCSKEDIEDDTHYLFDYLQVYVTSGERVPDYEEHPVNGDSPSNGQAECRHQFGNYVVTTKPTVLKKGKETRTCSLCGKTETRKVKKLKPAIKLSAKTLPLQVKKSTTALKVVFMQPGDKIVSFRSDNTKVAAVHKTKGKITAKKPGKAVITVKLKSGITAKCTVKVQKKKVATESLKLSAKKLTLKKGKSMKLKVTRSPLTSGEKITYVSSNKKVATVSGSGTIKGKKKGKAKITIKSGKIKTSCMVTVK